MSDQPKFGEWQPIETAPKDGAPILVCWPDGQFEQKGSAVVWWNIGYGRYPWELIETGYEASSAKLEHDPTHWTPIPPLPY